MPPFSLSLSLTAYPACPRLPPATSRHLQTRPTRPRGLVPVVQIQSGGGGGDREAEDDENERPLRADLLEDIDADGGATHDNACIYFQFQLLRVGLMACCVCACLWWFVAAVADFEDAEAFTRVSGEETATPGSATAGGGGGKGRSPVSHPPAGRSPTSAPPASGLAVVKTGEGGVEAIVDLEDLGEVRAAAAAKAQEEPKPTMPKKKPLSSDEAGT